MLIVWAVREVRDGGKRGGADSSRATKRCHFNANSLCCRCPLGQCVSGLREVLHVRLRGKYALSC